MSTVTAQDSPKVTATTPSQACTFRGNVNCSCEACVSLARKADAYFNFEDWVFQPIESFLGMKTDACARAIFAATTVMELIFIVRAGGTTTSWTNNTEAYLFTISLVLYLALSVTYVVVYGRLSSLASANGRTGFSDRCEESGLLLIVLHAALAPILVTLSDHFGWTPVYYVGASTMALQIGILIKTYREVAGIMERGAAQKGGKLSSNLAATAPKSATPSGKTLFSLEEWLCIPVDKALGIETGKSTRAVFVSVPIYNLATILLVITGSGAWSDLVTCGIYAISVVVFVALVILHLVALDELVGRWDNTELTMNAIRAIKRRWLLSEEAVFCLTCLPVPIAIGLWLYARIAPACVAALMLTIYSGLLILTHRDIAKIVNRDAAATVSLVSPKPPSTAAGQKTGVAQNILALNPILSTLPKTTSAPRVPSRAKPKDCASLPSPRNKIPNKISPARVPAKTKTSTKPKKTLADLASTRPREAKKTTRPFFQFTLLTKPFTDLCNVERLLQDPVPEETADALWEFIIRLEEEVAKLGANSKGVSGETYDRVVAQLHASQSENKDLKPNVSVLQHELKDLQNQMETYHKYSEQVYYEDIGLYRSILQKKTDEIRAQEAANEKLRSEVFFHAVQSQRKGDQIIQAEKEMKALLQEQEMARAQRQEMWSAVVYYARHLEGAEGKIQDMKAKVAMLESKRAWETGIEETAVIEYGCRGQPFCQREDCFCQNIVEGMVEQVEAFTVSEQYEDDEGIYDIEVIGFGDGSDSSMSDADTVSDLGAMTPDEEDFVHLSDDSDGEDFA